MPQQNFVPPNLNLENTFFYHLRYLRNAAKRFFKIYSELPTFNLNYKMYFHEIHVFVAISADL